MVVLDKPKKHRASRQMCSRDVIRFIPICYQNAILLKGFCGQSTENRWEKRCAHLKVICSLLLRKILFWLFDLLLIYVLFMATPYHFQRAFEIGENVGILSREYGERCLLIIFIVEKGVRSLSICYNLAHSFKMQMFLVLVINYWNWSGIICISTIWRIVRINLPFIISYVRRDKIAMLWISFILSK